MRDHPRPIAMAAPWALRVPLNLSGIIRIFSRIVSSNRFKSAVRKVNWDHGFGKPVGKVRFWDLCRKLRRKLCRRSGEFDEVSNKVWNAVERRWKSSYRAGRDDFHGVPNFPLTKEMDIKG